MKTEIVISRRDRDYNLLNRRKFQSRSWVKGMLHGLFILNSNLNYQVSPVYLNDIFGVSRAPGIRNNTYEAYAGTLNVAAAGGQSSLSNTLGYNTYPTFIEQWQVGIVVGTNGAAVTPLDYKLGSLIRHSDQPIDAAPKIVEYLPMLVDDTNKAIYASYVGMQSFWLDQDYTVTSAKIKVLRTGSPGTCTVSIRTYAAPTVVLATGTFDGDTVTNVSPGEWKEATFGASALLSRGTLYLLVVETAGLNSSNKLDWRYDAGYSYDKGGGFDGTSPTYNPTSLSPSGIFQFEIWGQFDQPGLAYLACSVSQEVYSHPNAQFTITRFFKNVSGATVSVAEIGLHCNMFVTYQQSGLFCILRDVVSPAEDVLDTEILQVDITPQITV